ncbi:hypothetical protein L3Q65_00265 (plasmid) [Amycolatopsis sp. FU40]|uniref:hypothetical protein n=1 Tax=Amycolatopsis sp. FU40 TaxID=2914159 RepID=UPI001F27D23A|nr:hypothetical protein [Amycolatopsis sp. FU40]UKD50733.1 hypothetical protein L3Q65_00265 [Amycolatopsis sp. FU40]
MTAIGGRLLGAAVPAAFAAGIAAARWKHKRGRSAEETAQRAAIRDLWGLARTFPTRKLFRDPETGQYLGVDRHHTLLEIAVSDVEFTDPATDRIPDAIVTSYHLGSVWRPMPPPIMRMHRPLNDAGPGRTWEEAGELLDFNERTGAMDTTAEELADLHAQLKRALHHPC